MFVSIAMITGLVIGWLLFSKKDEITHEEVRRIIDGVKKDAEDEIRTKGYTC
jgi:hypothetical protein